MTGRVTGTSHTAPHREGSTPCTAIHHPTAALPGTSPRTSQPTTTAAPRTADSPSSSSTPRPAPTARPTTSSSPSSSRAPHVAGVFGLVAAFLALLDFAAHTAVAIGGAAGPLGIGGITLKLARPRAK